MYSRYLHILTLTRNLRHYEAALSKANGEGFNIFNVLGIGHYEVRTHSPILAELLNPDGAHGQGSVFLKSFLTHLKITLDAESAKVSTEYHIGPQTEDEGGRLDILIRDRAGCEVLIENKIYAGLQQNQLGRYRKFSSRGTLIFLTLNGDAPEGLSAEQLQELNCICISYKNDIISWLLDCRKEAANAPAVRETLAQYIHLLQELTRQNTSTRMNQEITKAVLHDQDTFLAYTALCNAANEVRANIARQLVCKIQQIASDLELQLDQPVGDLSLKYGGFAFSSPMLRENGLGVCFEFGRSGYQDLYCGFYYLDKQKPSPVTAALQAAFKAEFGRLSTSSDLWPAWQHWEQHRYWDDSTFASIQFGHFADDLKQILQRLLTVARQACNTQPEPR